MCGERYNYLLKLDLITNDRFQCGGKLWCSEADVRLVRTRVITVFNLVRTAYNKLATLANARGQWATIMGPHVAQVTSFETQYWALPEPPPKGWTNWSGVAFQKDLVARYFDVLKIGICMLDTLDLALEKAGQKGVGGLPVSEGVIDQALGEVKDVAWIGAIAAVAVAVVLVVGK